MRKKTLFFYGLPAYGHTLSNLYLAGRLAGAGFRVVYYSAEPFQEVIREHDCEYRAYPIDWRALDLTDGERILKLYRLILQYTWEMLPELLEQEREERPFAVFFDSLALWGRAVGQLRHLPSFAFYSIASIDWTFGRCKGRYGRRGALSPWGKGLGAYAPGFSADFLRYAGELPRAAGYARRLRVAYGLKELGLLPVLMNRGDHELCGYSRMFQPGGQGFGPEYWFVGPLSVHRKVTGKNDFVCPESCPERPLIYISLGTVFYENEAFLQAVIDQLGACSGQKRFPIVLVWNGRDRVFPENFIVRPFVDQNEVLKKAALFLTAGGLNSLHEALYFGVPCLMYPQQGEQLLNARQFERLGFGRILRDPGRLRQEAMACMELRKRWDEERRRRMTAVSVGRVLKLLERYAGQKNGEDT